MRKLLFAPLIAALVFLGLFAVPIGASAAVTPAARSVSLPVHNLDRAQINSAFGASHYSDFDLAIWFYSTFGSWWNVNSDECFTTNYQDSNWVEIGNLGDAGHHFHAQWRNYDGWVALGGDSGDWYIPAHTYETFFMYVAPRAQSEHWRWRVTWQSSSGWTLLSDHTPWTNPSNDRLRGMDWIKNTNQCDSWSDS